MKEIITIFAGIYLLVFLLACHFYSTPIKIEVNHSFENHNYLQVRAVNSNFER